MEERIKESINQIPEILSQSSSNYEFSKAHLNSSNKDEKDSKSVSEDSK